MPTIVSMVRPIRQPKTSIAYTKKKSSSEFIGRGPSGNRTCGAEVDEPGARPT